MEALFLTLFEVLVRNWPSLLALGGFLVMMARGKATQAAIAEAVKVTTILATDVAYELLDNKQRREKAIEVVYANLPLWAKKMLSQDDLEMAVEQGWKFLAKPKLEDPPTK